MTLVMLRPYTRQKAQSTKQFCSTCPNEEDLDKIIMPEAIQREDAGESEEQRIAYVGISRARDNLYISVPTLSRERIKVFEDKKLPIQIVDLRIRV
jgi:hypothetical protein